MERELTDIPHEDGGFEFGTYMLHHTDKWLSLGVRRFMKVAREHTQVWKRNKTCFLVKIANLVLLVNR